MFSTLRSLIKGVVNAGFETVADRHALTILAQNVREAAATVQAAKSAVAVASAQAGAERGRLKILTTQIADLEERILAALGKNESGLATRAAEELARLEDEQRTSMQAHADFSAEVDRVKSTVRNEEIRLRELHRGQRLAEARARVQQANILGVDGGKSALAIAEETLSQIAADQSQASLAARAFAEMSPTDQRGQVVADLADAGCGAPLVTTAADVLARLKARIAAPAKLETA